MRKQYGKVCAADEWQTLKKNYFVSFVLFIFILVYLYLKKHRMSYTDFLMLMNQNTSNKLVNYKELCRFCLKNQPHGIDISDNNCNSKQQKDAILNNYINITKQYLPVSDEYPNFVCSSCEANLSHYAQFAQQIEQNAENWEVFLKNGSDERIRTEKLDVFNDYGKFNSMPVEAIEDIKTMRGYYEEILEDDSRTDSDANTYDALGPTLMKIEVINGCLNVATTAKRKRKIAKQASTDFERTCKICDEPTFPSLLRLYSHQKLQHPGKKIFSCDICSAGFMSKNVLVTHMNDRHAKYGKKHQCQFCAKLFYSDREVKGHEKIHQNARSYVCNLCGKGFNQKTILNEHLKSKVHNVDYKTKKHPQYSKKSRSYKRKYRCEHCVPSTVHASSEERAKHRYAMHRIYDCDICKNSFITLESLESHKLLHSNKPRPFVCSVCDATFNQSSHLSSHFKRRHTDEKTFQCSFCDKKFFENCELNAHTNLVHSKRKRVKCHECESDFASIKYLQKHILDRHSTVASPYDCKICGKKNGTGAKLELHRQKYHKERC